MIRLLIIPLLALLGLSPFEEPVGPESLSYEVRYLYGAINTKVATASFNLTPDRWEGQDVHAVNIKVRVKPIFRLFLNSYYLVDGYVSRPGFKPLYYYSPTGRGWGECRYSEGERGVHYWRQFDKMPEPDHFYYPNDGKTMELMSMLFHVRSYDFKPGEPHALTMLLGGQKVPAVFTLVGTDLERYPGHTAEVIQVELPERGLMENGAGNQITVWRDADGTRPILGMEVSLGRGFMLCNITQKKK